MADAFRVQLGATQAVSPKPAPATVANKPAVSGTSFTETLSKAQDIRFSNHAQKRMESRDIELSPENANRLSDAIDKAVKRGGKSSLVMVDDLAFIVNVRDRMVVTALDANHRGEGVFTQIDSVVFAEPSASASKPLLDKQG
jgi:flagellar operon protein